MKSILEGVRVLDFSRYVAGPYCATLLGYLGADVIRVERPGGGDDRDIAPVAGDGSGAVFLQTGCNKRGVCLKLSHEDAPGVKQRLIESADIVVCNFPAPVQKKLGFDYQSLKQIKSDIILANVSAYGDSGPMANLGGFDGVAQAMSGAMYITGKNGEPVKAAAPYVDYSSAVMMAFGVMAALRERDQTGQGQEVSASLLGTALAVFNSHLVEQSALDINRVGTGNRVQTSAPSDLFATTDGYVLVHCPGDAIFKRWARLMDKPEWVDDLKYSTDQARGDHREELCAPMIEWCAARSTEEALATLAENGIPAGPVLSPAEALVHPQVEALGVLGKVDYPGVSAAAVADLPVNLSLSDTGIKQRPPLAGEHTQEVLTELGYNEEEIAQLIKSGAIA